MKIPTRIKVLGAINIVLFIGVIFLLAQSPVSTKVLLIINGLFFCYALLAVAVQLYYLKPKLPAWIKALQFLRFEVRHDGTIRKFWSYEKALEFKNAVLGVSENLNFVGYDVLRGWVSFYYKCTYRNYPTITHYQNYSTINFNDGWTAEAEK